MILRDWVENKIKISPDVTNRLHNEFEIGIYEKQLLSNPNHLEALTALGYAYSQHGDHLKALEVDIKLSSLLPSDAMVHYNLACSHSQLKHFDEAIATLKKAIHLGYTDFEYMKKDQDLKNLRHDPRFKQLLEEKPEGV